MIQDKFQMTLHGIRCSGFNTSTANSFAFASAPPPEGAPNSLTPGRHTSWEMQALSRAGVQEGQLPCRNTRKVRFFSKCSEKSESSRKDRKCPKYAENLVRFPKLWCCGQIGFWAVGGGVVNPSKRLRFSLKINELSIRTSDTEKLIELTCEQLTIKISLSLLGF
jgi:hypothetical protein